MKYHSHLYDEDDRNGGIKMEKTQEEQKNLDEKNWEAVEPDVWKPEQDGDQIQGTLVNKQPAEGQVSSRYHLDTNDGIRMLWGGAVLDDRLALVNIGDFVRITYKGKEETKTGRKVKLYKVERYVNKAQQ